MDREFYEKLYEKESSERFLGKGRKKAARKRIRGDFTSQGFPIDEENIEDLLLQFFLSFYAKIRSSSRGNAETINDFINFPKETRIEVIGEPTERAILDEVKMALEIAAKYFNSHLHTFFSESMKEFIEEIQIYVLYILSQRSSLFRILEVNGKAIFRNKVKVHSRFAGRRMKISENKKWTEERILEIVNRQEEIEMMLAESKLILPAEKNTTTRLKSVYIRFPFLKNHDVKISRLLTKRTRSTVRSVALEILMEELNEKDFNINSDEYLESTMRNFRKKLLKKAA